MMIVALVVALSVACVFAPWGTQRERSPGTAVFWIAFPLTCFAVAAAVGMFVAWPQSVDGSSSLWWDLSLPRSPRRQFLAGEQYHQIAFGNRMRWALPVFAVSGVGVCAWAWHAGRR